MAAPEVEEEARELACSLCHQQMELVDISVEHGFSKWACSKGCKRVVGIDHDPEVGGVVELDRGLPWLRDPKSFKP